MEQKEVIIIGYPKCSTCKKAEDWLKEQNIKYVYRDIVGDNPKAEELKKWYEENEYPLKRFFNTSGLIYREKNLKDILPTLSEEEQLALLAENGMLVKRPLLLKDGKIAIGFKEVVWENFLGIE